MGDDSSIHFNFSAPINEVTSYGLVALNVISNSNCHVFPIGQQSYNFENRLFNNYKIQQSLMFDEWDRDIPSVRLFHQFSLAESIGSGKRVGWPIFELDKFSKKEKCDLRSLDQIIVCSDWAKKIILDNGINKQISVVPLGVNTTCFNPRIISENQKIDKTYRFFSCGKYEVRKGQDQIVEAFNLAFNQDDDVELLISMHNIFMQNEELEQKRRTYLSSRLGNKIKFVGPYRSQERVAAIMCHADCGVFPSKAEGWGLETLEMMACGKPVIVSDYSGHTEYCNSLNSILIPVTDKEPAYDGKWFFNQGNWGVVKTEDIVEAMRHAFKSDIRTNEQGVITAQSLSWLNTATKLKESLV